MISLAYAFLCLVLGCFMKALLLPKPVKTFFDFFKKIFWSYKLFNTSSYFLQDKNYEHIILPLNFHSSILFEPFISLLSSLSISPNVVETVADEPRFGFGENIAHGIVDQ